MFKGFDPLGGARTCSPSPLRTWRVSTGASLLKQRHNALLSMFSIYEFYGEGILRDTHYNHEDELKTIKSTSIPLKAISNTT